MRKYIEYAAKIYSIYLRYISKDDIHPYSIDEMFLDVTSYLNMYNTTGEMLAKALVGRIYKEIGLTATVGVGTNLFLSKVALDICAKHSPDNIGFLDEELFRKKLWTHRPLSDFWQIAGGTERRLNKLGLYTLKDVAYSDEDILYKEFGINAEILIDHSKGIEPVMISDIKSYKNKSHSISNSQVLFEDYDPMDARLIVKEMVELLSLKLVDNNLVTNSISLFVGYSKDTHRYTGGMRKMTIRTNVFTKILPYFLDIYDTTTSFEHKVRRVGISFNNVIEERYEYYDLFTSPDEVIKERNLCRVINDIKKKYGKNSILKGMNLEEKATTIIRNKLIGGHNAEENDKPRKS
jgi:DNA polymerase V